MDVNKKDPNPTFSPEYNPPSEDEQIKPVANLEDIPEDVLEGIAEEKEAEIVDDIPVVKPKKIKRSKNLGIYMLTLISKEIVLSINSVGKNIKQILEKIISTKYEGKCIVEGFLKFGSSKIITYSSGTIEGENIRFQVVFECLICCPVEGMNIKCIAKNITKAGIRAETGEKSSPVVIFIARDHHNTSKYFSKIKEDDEINIRVIGQRFELNDKYISIIAELIEQKNNKFKKKKRLKIKD
jgi:DNA-directed RNA polymerase subunit E'/Rpb7